MKYLNPQRYLFAWVALVMFTLAGCGGFGFERPKSFDGSLGYAKGALASAYKAIGDAVYDGHITEGERDEWVKDLDKVRDGLKEAKGFYDNLDVSTAWAKLNTALDILKRVQRFLGKWYPQLLATESFMLEVATREYAVAA